MVFSTRSHTRRAYTILTVNQTTNNIEPGMVVRHVQPVRNVKITLRELDGAASRVYALTGMDLHWEPDTEKKRCAASGATGIRGRGGRAGLRHHRDRDAGWGPAFSSSLAIFASIIPWQVLKKSFAELHEMLLKTREKAKFANPRAVRR